MKKLFDQQRKKHIDTVTEKIGNQRSKKCTEQTNKAALHQENLLDDCRVGSDSFHDANVLRSFVTAIVIVLKMPIEAIKTATVPTVISPILMIKKTTLISFNSFCAEYVL